MKRPQVILIIFLLLWGANAQEEESGISGAEGLEAFELPKEEIAGIAPPPPPEEEITGIGPPRFNLFLEIKDSNLKNTIKDVHVQIETWEKSTGEKTKTLKYVDEGVIKFRLNQGEWRIILKADDLSTSGKDYFVQEDFNINRDLNQSIFLLPVGSVRGIVHENDNVVEGAVLKFDCVADYGEKEQETTDSFGSFASEWLPIGSCMVSAIYSNKVGSQEVGIKQGQINDIEINLTRGILQSYSKWVYGIIVIAIIIIIAFYFYRIKMSEEAIAETQPKPETEVNVIEINQRARDILNTLKDREKEIVNFLLENDNKSTQARIYNTLGIPKTSLSRILKSLELKGIVQIEKIGKLKKVKLTDWFLGKEEKEKN